MRACEYKDANHREAMMTEQEKDFKTHMRQVRSFVRREGRLSSRQTKALDQLWPEYGVEYQEEYLNLERLFGNACPVTLEIGFGMGSSLIETVAAQQETNFIGIEATQHIIENLKLRAKSEKIHEGEALINCLKAVMADELKQCNQPLVIPEQDLPFIILMVGINGAGKTTTIGKLAKQFQSQGKSVMLAAGDTFRAAAIEQLQAWGHSNNVPVVAQHNGADSASVIYDAVQSATAKKIDILIADTAGRLHTQQGLMSELEKVKRVIQKLNPQAPHETMLVLDASIGQNALQQAKEFGKAIDISGITMTKLDGTAKGGILFAIAQQLKTPVRFIGVGEGAEDLQSFNANAFIDAVFSRDD